MMPHYFLYPSLVLVLFGVSGCSSLYDDSFECKAGTGIPCRSISAVNDMVSAGEIGQKESVPSSSDQSPASQSSEALPLSFKEERLSKDASHRVVSRRPEKTVRVWIASHLEEAGTYTGERYVYTVIEPGAWVEEERSSLGRTQP